jgi:hypothetical protein
MTDRRAAKPTARHQTEAIPFPISESDCSMRRAKERRSRSTTS